MTTKRNTLEDDYNYLVSYAQNREDIFLKALFKETDQGFYIDVGSGHPFHHSVTKLLYRSGWHGINIDYDKKLLALTNFDRLRDTQVDAKVGNTHSSSTMPTTSLKEVCTKNNVDTINLLKIDVDGAELNVISSNDWNRFRPQVVCVDVRQNSMDCRSTLTTLGYDRSYSDGLNDYYIDQRSEFSKQTIDYAKTALTYPHIVDNDVAGYIALLRKEKVVASYRVNATSRHIPNSESLRFNLKNTMSELVFIAKRRTFNDYPGFKSKVEKFDCSEADIRSYITAMRPLYRLSYNSRQAFSARLQSSSSLQRYWRRIKLLSFDIPAVLITEFWAWYNRRLA